MSALHTPGPWPREYSGDGKRIIIGKGLVEGPNGYDVAEVYSDDCDPAEAAANADLIYAAPELLEALVTARIALIAVADSAVEAGFGQLADLIDGQLSKTNAAITKARGETPAKADPQP